jgi:outer membrane protein TolC
MFIYGLQAQQVITLEDAIRYGLKNNFDIQIARNDAQVANNNRALGTAGFLPTLDVLGNAQYQDSRQETNSPFSFGNSKTEAWSGQILLNWTLFDGFRMFVDKGRFNRLAELGEAQARNIIENSIVGILVAYFDLVQQEQLLEVAQNTLEISETRLNKEKVRRDVGGASSTDFLNAQVSYNNDKGLVINQELRVTVALNELNIALGQKPDTEIEVDKEINIPPLSKSFEEILTMALERNSELIVVQKSREISQKEVKLAQSNFSPRLSLNSSYTYADRTISGSARFEEDINTKSRDGLIGLNLSWNLFNGFRHKIELENAQIDAKSDELSYRDTRNRLEGLLREVYQTFHKRLELIELEEQNVVAAQQNLQLQQDRYDIGSATFLEFRDAQVNLNRAQTTLIIARFQSRITRLEIERLTGNLEIN